jgi:arylsulfatase A-like enzyme
MKKLCLPKTVVILSAWFAAVPCFAQDAKQARPNVILCMTDDQGWSDVSYNELGRLTKGKFKTGELDKMAASGLRKGLQERCLTRDTMLWFCSDNGLPGANAPLKGGKGGVNEGGIRVPGICEWPTRVQPWKTSVPAVTSDFYPTLFAAAGISMPDDKPQPIDGLTCCPCWRAK